MSLTYETVKENPTQLRACTGMDRAEFEALIPAFTQAWEAHQQTHHRPLKSRKRALGGGRKGHLPTVEAKLFFILFYFKTYPLQTVMGVFLG